MDEATTDAVDSSGSMPSGSPPETETLGDGLAPEANPDAPVKKKKTGVAAETVQERGRKGVYKIRDWLESTTRFTLSWSVYDQAESCSLTCMDGSLKRLDLAGKYLTKGVPVYVECKKYSTPGIQAQEYKRFLAIAYSATEKSIEDHGQDNGNHYMWVTTHPFSLRKWKSLTTATYIHNCVKENPDLRPGDPEINLDLIASLSRRVWVLVAADKQMKLRMSEPELLSVKTALVGGKAK
jgi:hypothetical protein